MNKQTHAEIKLLSKLNAQLHKEGGPEKNGLLFEEIISMEDDILNSFGLPTNHPEYSQLLQFESELNDEEVEEIIENIKTQATTYLMQKVETDLEKLEDAQKYQLEGDRVLSELKITNHIYTIYVYDKILLTGLDTPKRVLEELKLVNQYKTLSDIAKIKFGSLNNKKEIIDELESKGLKYVREFLE